MLKQRMLTAVVALIVVTVALFVLPQWATRLIIAVLMLMAAWEWSRLIFPGRQVQEVAYTGLVALLAAATFMLVPETISSQVFFGFATVWWILAFVWLLFHPTPIPIAVGSLCGVLVIVPAWFAIDWIFLRSNLSLLTVLLLVLGADTGAFFAGKRFGRVKLAPAISPGKTWEGVLGGMVVVSLVATACAWLTGGNPLTLVPLFLAIAVISIVGDLTVSVFKRKAGVKDSGRLFPGHGGVLDRIDSISAATPVFALALAAGVIA